MQISIKLNLKTIGCLVTDKKGPKDSQIFHNVKQ